MSKKAAEHHNKAADHHDHAAKHHRENAKPNPLGPPLNLNVPALLGDDYRPLTASSRIAESSVAGDDPGPIPEFLIR